MHLATNTMSSSLKPLVVTAAVPNLKPDVIVGFWVSFGIAFLLAVILTECKIFSAFLPVTPTEPNISTKIKWLSVPPDTSL